MVVCVRVCEVGAVQRCMCVYRGMSLVFCTSSPSPLSHLAPCPRELKWLLLQQRLRGKNTKEPDTFKIRKQNCVLIYMNYQGRRMFLHNGVMFACSQRWRLVETAPREPSNFVLFLFYFEFWTQVYKCLYTDLQPRLLFFWRAFPSTWFFNMFLWDVCITKNKTKTKQTLRGNPVN